MMFTYSPVFFGIFSKNWKYIHGLLSWVKLLKTRLSFAQINQTYRISFALLPGHGLDVSESQAQWREIPCTKPTPPTASKASATSAATTSRHLKRFGRGLGSAVHSQANGWRGANNIRAKLGPNKAKLSKGQNATRHDPRSSHSPPSSPSAVVVSIPPTVLFVLYPRPP